MNVSLASELVQFLDEQVRDGRHSSPEEAVTKAVELLRQTNDPESRLAELLQEAEESGPAGDGPGLGDVENEGLKKPWSRKSA